MSGGDLREQLDEVGVFSEKRAKIYAAEITSRPVSTSTCDFASGLET
jgi:hypothetical protein